MPGTYPVLAVLAVLYCTSSLYPSSAMSYYQQDVQARVWERASPGALAGIPLIEYKISAHSPSAISASHLQHRVQRQQQQRTRSYSRSCLSLLSLPTLLLLLQTGCAILPFPQCAFLHRATSTRSASRICSNYCSAVALIWYLVDFFNKVGQARQQCEPPNQYSSTSTATAY